MVALPPNHPLRTCSPLQSRLPRSRMPKPPAHDEPGRITRLPGCAPHESDPDPAKRVHLREPREDRVRAGVPKVYQRQLRALAVRCGNLVGRRR